MAERKKILSLFSGAGGMDIGFEGGFWCLRRSVNEERCGGWIDGIRGFRAHLRRTPFDTVFADDIRVDAARSWRSWFSDRDPDIFHVESIVDLIRSEKEHGGVLPSGIDVVTGGFPCQDFSVAGLRLGFDSRRSHDGGCMEAGEPSIESRGLQGYGLLVLVAKPKLAQAV